MHQQKLGHRNENTNNPNPQQHKLEPKNKLILEFTQIK